MNQQQRATSHPVIKKEMPPPGIFNWVIWIPRRILRGCIVIYQKTLSLDHGPMSHIVPFPVCKYHPTCSEYGYQAITRFGVFKGIPLTIWRILRCNPWSEGGEDPIPNGEKQVDKFKAEDVESPSVSSEK